MWIWLGGRRHRSRSVRLMMVTAVVLAVIGATSPWAHADTTTESTTDVGPTAELVSIPASYVGSSVVVPSFFTGDECSAILAQGGLTCDATFVTEMNHSTVTGINPNTGTTATVYYTTAKTTLCSGVWPGCTAWKVSCNELFYHGARSVWQHPGSNWWPNNGYVNCGSSSIGFSVDITWQGRWNDPSGIWNFPQYEDAGANFKISFIYKGSLIHKTHWMRMDNYHTGYVRFRSG
jgi:hypothetical protein